MKARIKNNDYSADSIGIPPRLLFDKEYAEEFWNYLKKANPDENYGETFDEWYNKLTTINFADKCKKTDKLAAIYSKLNNTQKGGD